MRTWVRMTGTARVGASRRQRSSERHLPPALLLIRSQTGTRVWCGHMRALLGASGECRLSLPDCVLLQLLLQALRHTHTGR